MCRFFVGSWAVALAVVACSSFDSDPALDALPEAGVPDATSVMDTGVDASVGAPGAAGKWMFGLGSAADDIPAGIAWSGGSLYLSTSVGAPIILGPSPAPDAAADLNQGVAVVKINAADGSYGKPFYNFTGDNQTGWTAGPIAAGSDGVFASGTATAVGFDHDVSLRSLAPGDLTLLATVTANGPGGQEAIAATHGAVGGVVYALGVGGFTQLNGGFGSNSDAFEPGVVSAFATPSSLVQGYFVQEATMMGTANAVALDSNGRIVLAGSYVGYLVQGDVNDGGRGPMASDEDAFVTRYTPAGQPIDRLVFGGANVQRITSLATHINDRYVAGTFTGTLAFGTQTLTVSDTHGFVARIGDDNSIAWIVDIGRVAPSFMGIAVDDDRVIVAGTFDTIMKIGAETLTPLGGSDVFVASLDPVTGAVRSANAFGRESPETLTAFATDKQGNFFLAGTFEGATSLNGTVAIVSHGGRDAFVLAVHYD